MISRSFQLVNPVYRVGSILRGQTRRLGLSLGMVMVSIGLLGLLMSPATAQTSSDPPVTASKSAGAVIQHCIPAASYGSPSQLNLTTATNGLTKLVEPVSYYQVYGSTTAQIDHQVQQCAPSSSKGSDGNDEFAAATGYSLSWQYDTASDTNGICSVVDAKVGLHLTMVLPAWQPTATASNGLAGAWHSFSNGLATHENGHAAIDRQYAGQLLNDLRTYPATDCASIAAGLQTKMSTDIAGLTAANNAYDAQTNHGATQGAILP